MGVPHGRSGWPQSGQPSLRRASAMLAAAVSKTSIIVHPARIGLAVSSAKGGGWCCSLAPDGGPRNPGGLTAGYRHRADAHAPARPAGTQVTAPPRR